MDRTTRLLPLGPQRLRLLDCLGGNDPRVPGYLAPAADAEILAAFRHYVEQLAERCAAESDPNAVSLIAAARLLIGDLSAAELILDHLPAKPRRLDHGAGACLLMPLYALNAALPLPKDLADTSRWLAGSAAAAAVRSWLGKHRDALVWVESAGGYRFAVG